MRIWAGKSVPECAFGHTASAAPQAADASSGVTVWIRDHVR
jgi:hypothetical protein